MFMLKYAVVHFEWNIGIGIGITSGLGAPTFGRLEVCRQCECWDMKSGSRFSKERQLWTTEDEETIFNKSLVPRLFGGTVVIIQSGSFKGRGSWKGEKVIPKWLLSRDLSWMSTEWSSRTKYILQGVSSRIVPPFQNKSYIWT